MSKTNVVALARSDELDSLNDVGRRVLQRLSHSHLPSTIAIMAAKVARDFADGKSEEDVADELEETLRDMEFPVGALILLLRHEQAWPWPQFWSEPVPTVTFDVVRTKTGKLFHLRVSYDDALRTECHKRAVEVVTGVEVAEDMRCRSCASADFWDRILSGNPGPNGLPWRSRTSASIAEVVHQAQKGPG